MDTDVERERVYAKVDVHLEEHILLLRSTSDIFKERLVH